MSPESKRPAFYTTEELAELLKVPVGTVHAWRYRGVGPRGHKIGRFVRYSVDETHKWIEAQSDDRRSA